LNFYGKNHANFMENLQILRTDWLPGTKEILRFSDGFLQVRRGVFWRSGSGK